MNNTFEIKKGKLVFEEDKIVIIDNARSERAYRVFSVSMLLLLGISFLIQYINAHAISSLRLGLLFLVAAVVNFAYEFFKSAQEEILLKDVKSFKMNRLFFRNILYIKLANHKTRMVNGIFNIERLEEYLETIQFQNKSK